MFKKILIANRGEIACRVIATARRMGIATVAVYSEADREAKHVAWADEAVLIGPAPVADSYLRVDRILDAARATGAEAIHPGYGFLSENPDFVAAVEDAGLTFIGPPADAIRAMGLKDAAKAVMEAAGVPVVPGYHGAAQDPETLAAEAEAIGYPVLIKARAGGGGKGMRRVENSADFRAALESAQREGQASFGDPHCLIEKYITAPRHVEIQVFADGHGNVVHLFERDCSLQRRHQKVIEEAPAPGMPDQVRDAMGAAAVEAARAIGYVGAGTVEFIADGADGLRPDGFWFMEMNTRLQVEHPVTEAITGLDLVALQLRVAAGEPLPFTQADLAITGHAVEARIYAEDPTRGFLPATGQLDRLTLPEGTEFAQGDVRIDAGVRAGDHVTPFYDPMIAKLIVHRPTRAEALAAMSRALAETEIAGLVSNVPFLQRLVAHPRFSAGDVETGLIAEAPDLVHAPAPDQALRDVAMLAALDLLDPPQTDTPWTALRGWRAWGTATHRQALIYGDETFESHVTLGPETRVDGRAIAVTPFGGDRYSVTTETQRTYSVLRQDRMIRVFDRGVPFAFAVPDPLASRTEGDSAGDVILSPMPGKVTAISVAPGDTVAKGAALMILEAMKMEHTLTAPRDGVVADIAAAVGDQTADGAVLVRLEVQDD
ncbi:MAG: acetyl/propionyl/methylcrotonyl-CoA carboxylase subunit alpha [Pseudomonadota bacterium]